MPCRTDEPIPQPKDQYTDYLRSIETTSLVAYDLAVALVSLDNLKRHHILGGSSENTEYLRETSDALTRFSCNMLAQIRRVGLTGILTQRAANWESKHMKADLERAQKLEQEAAAAKKEADEIYRKYGVR